MSAIDDAIEHAEEWANDTRQIYRTAALLAAEVKKLRAQVAAVEALHWRDEAPTRGGGVGYFCFHCSALANEYVNWPCLTRAALASGDEVEP